MTASTIDQAKLDQALGQIVVDAGSALVGLLIYAGDRLGLYTALAGAGALTPAQIARKTGTNERIVREWALANSASGYLTYDAKTGAFTLPPEQAAILADTTESPAIMAGFFQAINAAYRTTDKLLTAFKTGKGLGWGDQHPDLFYGTERFFRPGYEASLVSEWIPALQGVDAKLKAGAKVADVGCGHGASTVIMAKAYPKSTFVGYDFHGPSIERARKLAADEGVADRVTFEVARATDFPGKDWDLIAFFDCVHDMGDPEGAAKHARSAVAKDGTILLVEPHSTDAPEQNIASPVGRVFYAASTVFCTPSSLSEDGPALGAQAGPGRLSKLFTDAGFRTVHAAHTTPFNIVFEAKP